MQLRKVLGVIAARGGSKGVPKKNIAPLAGKPLIEYTIAAARTSKRLTRVIVSTDDEEIAAASHRCGVEVPFLRPKHLATDDATSVNVVLHATRWAEENERDHYDAVMLLQPTAPLRTASDIDEAIDLLAESVADSVVSVSEVEEPHPAKMLKIVEGSVVPFLPDSWGEHLPRQSLESVYFPNGAVYCVTRDALFSYHSLWGKKVIAYVMPRARSVNVDTELDLLLAEKILTRKGQE